nr:hypothetical protein [Kibdelosporangium sp. MJ126-NF4]
MGVMAGSTNHSRPARNPKIGSHDAVTGHDDDYSVAFRGKACQGAAGQHGFVVGVSVERDDCGHVSIMAERSALSRRLRSSAVPVA